MPVVILDGPEKAGKTTLIKALQAALEEYGFGSVHRPWGPVKSELDYLAQLKSDCRDPRPIVFIWDRSWASEHAYALMLDRDRRLRDDPFLGEWWFGRAVQSTGVRVMLNAAPPDLAARRDSTDLPVNPYMESAVFSQYAERFGWLQLFNDYSAERLSKNAEEIINHLLLDGWALNTTPPIYCGPLAAQVVVVGEVRNDDSRDPGHWLPLTTRLTTRIGRALKDRAFELGWTNANDCPQSFLKDRVALVTLGKVAESWARLHVGHQNVLALPHPAWLYRYGSAQAQVPLVEQRLITFIDDNLK